jgi:deazaflavin-dependent oxidoreductase (nitroreductase family)
MARLPAATRLVMKLDVWSVRLAGGSFFMWLFSHSQGLARDPQLKGRKAQALVLVTVGRRSGRRRQVVLPYFTFGDSTFVVGSKGGAPEDPDWVQNLRQSPRATVYVDRRPRTVTTRIATAQERAALWPQLVAFAPTYAGYQARVAREIPLILLE